MERTGVTPRGAVVAPDLAEVVRKPGPFVSVYLATESGIENAAQKSELGWKNLRRELAGAGAPESVLTGIDGLIADAHLSGQTLAVLGSAEGILHVEHGPEPPPRDRGEVGPVPVLEPILAWRQSFPTFVTVLADRTGADISVFRLERPVLQEEAGDTVDDFPIRKVKPGGWSQPRYERRAENTWEKNADDVAEVVGRLVERYDPRILVAAGDVRALELIQKALPDTVRERFETVDGGRSADGSDELFPQRARERLAAAVERDTADVLGKFREELGQADRAADGPDDTLAALARAQVEVLLVTDAAEDERVALFGPEPTDVGRERDDLRAMGVDEPQEARLVDVALRAAIGTGAGVRIVPDSDVPTGRLGAILRWS